MMSVLKKIKNNKKITNSIWILSEKLISIFGLLFVTSYVAKYLGPEKFGLIAIALLIFQFLQTVSSVGCDLLIIKRVSQNVSSGINIIFSYILIVPIIYLFLSLVFFSYIFFFKSFDNLTLLFFFSSCIACFFSATDLVNYYNEATLNAKFNVICNVIGLVISLTLRFLITHFNLDIKYLAVPIVLVTFIPWLIRNYHLFLIRKVKVTIKNSKDIKKYIKYCLRAGFGVLFSAIAVAIYTRINQASIAYFLGFDGSGLYSVALTLSTAWVFIPNALLMSLFPNFYSEKDFESSIIKLQKIILIVTFVSIFIILNIFFFAGLFVKQFYGVAYIKSLSSIYILSFASMLAILSGVLDRFTVKYGGSSYLVYKSLVVLAFCGISSVLLVPFIGIEGASFSVLLTEFFSCTFSNYFFMNGIHLTIQKSFFNPYKLKLILLSLKRF